MKHEKQSSASVDSVEKGQMRDEAVHRGGSLSVPMAAAYPSPRNQWVNVGTDFDLLVPVIVSEGWTFSM